jgi:hypothetical protein
MELMSKQDLTKTVRERYYRASKETRKSILNEFVANTGYHRKYALALLNKKGSDATTPHRRQRRRVYTGEVVDALVLIWKTCDGIASRRLHPFLSEMVAVLERQDDLHLFPDNRQLLLAMSRSTMDRVLKPTRQAARPHGRSTTKPGTLLKQSIPIRTWAEWNDAQPGFLEIDLVAHCGESTEGAYLESLNVVDIATAWCECCVPLNQGQQAVRAALVEIRQRLPIPVLGIDSDNDSAFINDHLKRYCDDEQITFTRSRPYKKNDQAHIEQKNWTVVRRYIGYDRYEGVTARVELKDLYRIVRFYVNFFQPVMKLKEKTRVDGKVKKVYDVAQTPYQRVLASPSVSEANKEKLTQLYLTLNPVTLYATIQKQLRHIWEVHALKPGESLQSDGKTDK